MPFDCVTSWTFYGFVLLLQGQDNRHEVVTMKLQIRFYYDKGVSFAIIYRFRYDSWRFDQNLDS